MTMDSVQTNGDNHPESALEYESAQYRTGVLENLNKFRKKNEFCDAILVVGRHELPVHKAVVASSSPYLMERFTKHKQDETEGLTKNMIKLKDVSHESFQFLLDYMYTGRLSVPGPEVKAVYKTAVKLKIADAAQTCSKFLAANLSVANCLGVRQVAIEDELRKQTDLFIQNNIISVMSSKKFFGLPTIKVEIIGVDGYLLGPSNSRHILDLALNWAMMTVDPQKPRLDDLTDQVNVLYLNKDNTITDCKDINDERTKEDEDIQDYKIIKKRQTPQKPDKSLQDNSTKGPLAGNVKVFSINPEKPVAPKEWAVIASSLTEKQTFSSICMVNGDLGVFLIYCRKKPSTSPPDSGSEAPDSPTQKEEMVERSVSLTPLASMTSPRCGFGITVVSDMLFACGGYDRGECMQSTEMYDPITNKWNPAANMTVPRGRFKTAVVAGQVYAVGGSNGHVEQPTVECFDPDLDKWSKVTKTGKAKTSVAVIGVESKLYCIGGCVGQNSVTDCDVYDTETKTWSKIAPLPTARYQIAACYYKGFIYTVGGTDGWNCLAISEIYDIESNKWVQGPSLNVPRRGAGCDIYNNKLYVVGGSDGQHSLKTIEILENNSFSQGPQMSIGRANVGVSTLNNRLYAVGGFSGKKFLDTIEYLDIRTGEWSGYVPNNNGEKNSEEVEMSR